MIQLLTKRATLLAAVATLAACTQASSSKDEVLAHAGGQDITAGLFSTYTQQVARGKPEQLDAAYRERLLQQLVQLTVAAEREAALADRDTADTVALARLNLLAHAGATRAGVFAEPSSTELQTAYNRFVKSRPSAEFHVAHILVPTETMALDMVRQLGHGANFAALAKTESADESRSRGGDLGWIRPGPLPKQFTDALMTLKAGEYTTKPVKTAYGWHVIRLLETRSVSVPTLEEVRGQLVANLQQERYEKFLRSK